MPPRHVYWTIILEGKPTAFRAHTREELQPTFKQLSSKHADIQMKWFARGKLWESPEEEKDLSRRGPGSERRAASWRPGGKHEDPRERFKIPRDEKRRRFAERLHRRPSGRRPDDVGDEPRNTRRPRPDAAAGYPARPARVRDRDRAGRLNRRPHLAGTPRSRSGRPVRAARAPGRRLASIVRTGPRARAQAVTRIGRAAKDARLAIGRGHRARSHLADRGDRTSGPPRGGRGGWDKKPWDKKPRRRAGDDRPAGARPAGPRGEGGDAPRGDRERKPYSNRPRGEGRPPAIGRGRRARSRLAIAAIGRPDRRAGPVAGGRRNPGTRSRARRPRAGRSARRRQTLRPARGRRRRAARRSRAEAVLGSATWRTSRRRRSAVVAASEAVWRSAARARGSTPARVRAVVGTRSRGTRSRDRQVRRDGGVVGLGPGPRGRGTAAAPPRRSRAGTVIDGHAVKVDRPATGRGRRARPSRDRPSSGPRKPWDRPAGSRPPGSGGRPQGPGSSGGDSRPAGPRGGDRVRR